MVFIHLYLLQNGSNPWYQIAGGEHGYDNAYMSMKAIFMARGPDFKQGYHTSRPISNLDIYPLISHILGINPAPNNGSLDRTLPFLRPRHNELLEYTVSKGARGTANWTVVMLLGVILSLIKLIIAGDSSLRYVQ